MGQLNGLLKVTNGKKNCNSHRGNSRQVRTVRKEIDDRQNETLTAYLVSSSNLVFVVVFTLPFSWRTYPGFCFDKIRSKRTVRLGINFLSYSS